MYFITERDQDKELGEITLQQRLKTLLLNVYILTFVVFDLAFIKRKAYDAGIYNLNGLYVLMVYFFIAEGYGLYLYFESKQKIKAEEISWLWTIVWHLSSMLTMMSFGFTLSSAEHQFFSVYFMVRLTIYASTFFLILSHLRVVRRFVLRKGELKSALHRHALWQLANFSKLFYASLLGNTIDVIAFGNDLNYYCWLSMVGIWAFYEFNKVMEVDHKWKYLKHVFEAE